MIRRGIAVVSLCALSACATATGYGLQGGVGTSQQRVAELTLALRANPNDVGVLVGLGDEYSRQAAWQQAAGAYREALIVNPGHREALLGFAGTQVALRQYQTALLHADRAMSGGAASVDAMNIRGIALSGLGQQADARAVLDAAFLAAPRDLDVRNNLALTLALSGDGSGYQIARGVAFAPEADVRHKRNFYLVAAILGQEASARSEGGSLGISSDVIDEVVRIGRSARTNGVSAFGIAFRS